VTTELGRFLSLAYTLYRHRSLIWQLAVHDLRSRYASTLMGSVWAIANPAITILVFWFVSVYGLRVSVQEGPPYFLVLFCGFVPWMMFSDAVTGGASGVLSYSYLVKKIAFPLEILPIVKIVSTVIVHGFLVALLVVILIVSGVPPTLHFVGALYFMACTVAFAAGLAWLLSALRVFSSDLGHALGAVMTIWFWATPILWPLQNLKGKALWIVQLNPVLYIVEGYRNALLYARPLSALWPLDVYFWTVTGFVLLLGAGVFRRLKPHFADVL